MLSYPASTIKIVTYIYIYILKKYLGKDTNKFSTKGHLGNKVQ